MQPKKREILKNDSEIEEIPPSRKALTRIEQFTANQLKRRQS